MLSYRHGFHAGNFADLFKHLLLTRLLLALQKKDKGLLYLDTHAGAGRYDLQDAFGRKIQEYEQGIGRLWGAIQMPKLITPYLELVRGFNRNGKLRYYPGSPAVAQALLRPQDRAVFCELHPSDHQQLEALFQKQRRTKVEQMDGFHALKAYLPPSEGRGLIHIDPPYELDREYSTVRSALLQTQRRFPGGTIALWYPLLTSRDAQQLPQRVAASGLRDVLQLELWTRAPGPGLYGTGMLVVRPPWKIEEEFQQLLPWMCQLLKSEEGGEGWRMERLVAE